jgi:hypothetical protein
VAQLAILVCDSRGRFDARLPEFVGSPGLQSSIHHDYSTAPAPGEHIHYGVAVSFLIDSESSSRGDSICCVRVSGLAGVWLHAWSLAFSAIPTAELQCTQQQSADSPFDSTVLYFRICWQIFGGLRNIPCRAQYASVGQIPLEFKAPHLCDAYFRVVEAIVMRECVLLKGKFTAITWLLPSGRCLLTSMSFACIQSLE